MARGARIYGEELALQSYRSSKGGVVGCGACGMFRIGPAPATGSSRTPKSGDRNRGRGASGDSRPGLRPALPASIESRS